MMSHDKIEKDLVDKDLEASEFLQEEPSDFDDFMLASQSSLKFWSNPYDEKDWES